MTLHGGVLKSTQSFLLNNDSGYDLGAGITNH